MQGNLTNQGLENSIIGTQVGSDVDAQLARSSSDMGLKLGLENQMSKIDFGSQYHQYGADMERNLMAQKMEMYGQAREKMLGGATDLLGIGGQYKWYQQNPPVSNLNLEQPKY